MAGCIKLGRKKKSDECPNYSDLFHLTNSNSANYSDLFGAWEKSVKTPCFTMFIQLFINSFFLVVSNEEIYKVMWILIM